MSEQELSTAQSTAVALSEDTGTAKIIYILYLATIVLGITGLIGVVMAYIYKDEAPEWLQSHYRFQIRTFWIGLLFSIIGMLGKMILIGWGVILFTLVWLVIRCVKGMKYLNKGEAVPNPGSWMFG